MFSIKHDKANILLITLRNSFQLRGWNIPPIGIAYVSSYLKSKDCHVFNLNLNDEQGDLYDILAENIVKYDIDMVATGGLVYDYAKVKELVNIVKVIDENIITIVGNGLVTYSPAETLQGIPDADIGIIGEGEISTYETIRAIEDGNDLALVKGIVYRGESGDIIITTRRPPIDNLDELPFPDWEGCGFFGNESTRSVVSTFKNIISAPLVTSRGCPFSCTYCSKSGGGGYRQRSLDNIFDELDILVNRYGVNSLIIDDELFSVNADRVNEFCKRIKPLELHFIMWLRVGRHMTDDLLKKMKESGCVQIFYGFESGSPVVLKSMKKGITTHDIYETVKRTSAAGIECHGNFIFGDIVETRETIRETLAFAHKLIRDGMTNGNVVIHYLMIRLWPGSNLYNIATQTRRIKDSLKFIEDGCPLTNVSMLTDEEYAEFAETTIEKEENKLAGHMVRKSVNFDIIGNLHEHKYTISFQCDKCGYNNEFELPSRNIFELIGAVCAHCNETRPFIGLRRYPEYVNGALASILSENDAAVWGAGFNFGMFYDFSDALRHNDWILIDSNPALWGKEKHGKILQPPTILNEQQRSSVIIASMGGYLEIEDELRKKYPFVKHVYKLWELIPAS